MTCVNCKFQFCWMCLAEYTAMHFNDSVNYPDCYMRQYCITKKKKKPTSLSLIYKRYTTTLVQASCWETYISESRKVSNYCFPLPHNSNWWNIELLELVLLLWYLECQQRSSAAPFTGATNYGKSWSPSDGSSPITDGNRGNGWPEIVALYLRSLSSYPAATTSLQAKKRIRGFSREAASRGVAKFCVLSNS